MSQLSRSHLRKRPLTGCAERPATVGEIDIGSCATIAYTSEDTEHPIEHLFDDHQGMDGTYWASDRSDVAEQLVLEFDRPQSVSRMIYEVKEDRLERTQEIRVEVSTDGGRNYRQLLVQEYCFSPRGATFQREDLRLSATELTHFRLTVIPNKGGSGRATLTSLRLFE